MMMSENPTMRAFRTGPRASVGDFDIRRKAVGFRPTWHDTSESNQHARIAGIHRADVAVSISRMFAKLARKFPAAKLARELPMMIGAHYHKRR